MRIVRFAHCCSCCSVVLVKHISAHGAPIVAVAIAPPTNPTTGNALKGGLDKYLNISSKLTDIVLSYNHLTGEIPQTMHRNSFETLDLSYNRFKGSFPPDFMPITSNGSLYLQVNRLSGDLPGTFPMNP